MSGDGDDGNGRGEDLGAAPYQWAPFTEAEYKAMTEVIANAVQIPERYISFRSTELGGPNVFAEAWDSPQSVRKPAADVSDGLAAPKVLKKRSMTQAHIDANFTGASLEGRTKETAMNSCPQEQMIHEITADLRAEQHAENVRHAALRSYRREQNRVPLHLNAAREALSAAADDIDTTLYSFSGDLVDLTIRAEKGLGHPQSVKPPAPFGVDYAADLVNFLKTADERIRAFHRELMEQAPDWSKYDTRQVTEAAPEKTKPDHPLAEGNWDYWKE